MTYPSDLLDRRPAAATPARKTGDKSYRLSAFPSHETDLIPAHRALLAQIADQITQSRHSRRPLRCVRLIGHSATWRGISTETYARRAMARAYAAATAIRSLLQDQGRTVRILADAAGQGRCRPPKGVDVVLYVGSRSDRAPLVENLVQRTDPAARANRAQNRRVEITLQAGPTPRPKRPKTVRLSLLYRGQTTDEVKRLARLTGRASHAAMKRMRALAQMDEPARRAAWNAGAEAVWFGPYEDGGRTVPFAVVKQFIDRSFDVFKGQRRTTGRVSAADRPRLLTIESVRGPADPAICRALSRRRDVETLHPVQRWIDAIAPKDGVAPPRRDHPRLKLASEKLAFDARYLRCFEQSTLGLAYRTLAPNMRAPRHTPTEPVPRKITLCPAWFKAPRGRRRRLDWHWRRQRTIAHEVAHLAGVAKLAYDPVAGAQTNAEIYGERQIKRLARRKPKLARINAENYGAYVMSFAPKG